MTILSSLQDEMKVAMKAHDQARLDALRLMVSALKYAQVDDPEIADPGMVEVLKKEAKKRRESIIAYHAGNREELAKKEEYELSLIEQYLPAVMSEDEVRKLVGGILQSVDSNASFGEVMQVAMKELKGQADGGMVAKIVKELFNPKS